MKPVESLQHFAELARSASRPGRRTLTNCYWLPADINTHSLRGNLCFMIVPAGVLFWRRDMDFDQLYYFLDAYDDLCLPAQQRPMLLELIGRDSGPMAEAMAASRQAWMRFGFEPYKTYHRMTMTAGSSRPDAPLPSRFQDEYSIRSARQKDAEAIHSLWRMALDPFTPLMPDPDALAALIDSQEVMAVTNRQGTIVGALFADRAGKVCVIRHLVVDPAHRRGGTARHLVEQAISQSWRAGARKFILWVAETNRPVRFLGRSLGFLKDGMISIQMTNKGENNE